MTKLKIAIITINQPSLNSALKLQQYLSQLNIDIYTSKKTPNKTDDIIIFDKLDDILPTAWEQYDIIIPILAIGAIVRKIAPLLQSKESDPAIIVINLDLTKIVPILSGHLGGGNNFAQYLTSKLPNSINFISTATDQTDTFAFDTFAQQNNFNIINLKALANISNRLLNNQQIKLVTYPALEDKFTKYNNIKLIDFANIDENSVIISPIFYNNTNLILKPKSFLGIGCNRNTPFEDIDKAVKEFLTKYNLSIQDIKNIASFEAKQDEKGLIEFAKKYNFNIKFFTKNDINSLEQKFTTSASTKFFGLKGVAEPSAILISKYKQLIVAKEIYFSSITIALSI